jgi:hypothetical protein
MKHLNISEIPAGGRDSTTSDKVGKGSVETSHAVRREVVVEYGPRPSLPPSISDTEVKFPEVLIPRDDPDHLLGALGARRFRRARADSLVSVAGVVLVAIVDSNQIGEVDAPPLAASAKLNLIRIDLGDLKGTEM